jgi:hypothetical protein
MNLFLLATTVLALVLPLPFSSQMGLPVAPLRMEPEDLPAADSLAWRIAARATGEADVVGAEGVYLVACTMVNRLGDERTPEGLTGVLRAYFAPDRRPTAEAVALAEEALVGGCPPVRYAFSRTDTARLGFDRSTADFVVKHGGWAIYFWSVWPG